MINNDTKDFASLFFFVNLENSTVIGFVKFIVINVFTLLNNLLLNLLLLMYISVLTTLQMQSVSLVIESPYTHKLN